MSVKQQQNELWGLFENHQLQHAGAFVVMNLLALVAVISTGSLSLSYDIEVSPFCFALVMTQDICGTVYQKGLCTNCQQAPFLGSQPVTRRHCSVMALTLKL